MNRFSLNLTCLMLAAAAVAAPSYASAETLVDGDAERGKDKSLTCAACHGADGNSVNPEWPSLAGQHARYTYNQLAAFKSGSRENVLMTSQAMLLSEQDMKDLAAYYEAQTPTRRPVADESLVARGEALWRGGDTADSTSACIACHGPGGRGNPAAAYPLVSGQHATYAAKALRDYASGARTSDMNQIMRNVAATLNDEDIDALAGYMQGLN